MVCIQDTLARVGDSRRAPDGGAHLRFRNLGEFCSEHHATRSRSAVGAGLLEYSASLLLDRLERESTFYAWAANTQRLGGDLCHYRGVRYFEAGSRQNHR